MARISQFGPIRFDGMVTVRCTRKLLKRLKVKGDSSVPSTTRLGDWYANLLFVPRTQLVLFTSERTLLPLVLPAREIKSLATRFSSALEELLDALGVSAPVRREEMEAMKQVGFGPTANRQVLGTMNDFQRMLPYHLAEESSLLDVSLQLAEAPCGPIGMESPNRLTRQLFLGRS